MKITDIQVEKFRNISDIDIAFAPRLNAIAGQNGTSKTSVLGLIGHVFTFGNAHKTLAGKKFATEFSDIFKFAYPTYDKAGNHRWLTKLDTDQKIPAISYDRKQKGKQNTLRVRVGGSKQNSKKVAYPVIYLGMGRLFPLTLERSIVSNTSVLSTEETKEFIDLHNEILMIIDENVQPESITSSSKRFYAAKTDKYDHLGNSAGQDNLGQIITALLSFKRLRAELGDKYDGGILLIDELDASLFPAAQMKLVEKLHKKALELNLQIFFTTHSLEVLAETAKFKDSKIIFLDKGTGSIQPRYGLNVPELRKSLLVLGPDALHQLFDKKYVYCEDDEAVDMLKSILPKDIKDKVDIISTKLGAGNLKEIAKRKIPDFKDSIIVLDGDEPASDLKNVVSLPGDFGPDRLLYELLRNYNAEKFGAIEDGYSKQYCFRDLNSLDSTNDDSRKREKVKKWYKSQKKYWGRNAGRVWKIWSEGNEESVAEFVESFRRLV